MPFTGKKLGFILAAAALISAGVTWASNNVSSVSDKIG